MIAYECYRGADATYLTVDADHYVPDRAAFAARHCDPAEGIPRPDGRRGADGALFLALEPEYSPPRVVMTVVRPDGGRTPTCTDGVGCAAAWAAERTGVDRVMVDTQAGTCKATVHGDGTVSVETFRPSVAPDDVGLAREEPLVAADVAGHDATALSVAGPHAVVDVADLAAVDPAGAAPAVREALSLPDAAVTLASKVRTDSEAAALGAESVAADGAGVPADAGDLAYECRTVPGTDGVATSGTGAVAVAAAAVQRGTAGTDEAVAVSAPDAEFTVRVPGSGRAVLRGPVVRTTDGEIPRPAP